MKKTKKYDYIILGAGASGLSLAHRMLNNTFFDDKRICIIDRDEKKTNDRTWCFWEVGEGHFEEVIRKKWDEIQFYSKTLEKRQSVTPYQYKMISGLDFYNFVRPKLEASPKIDLITAEIQEIKETESDVNIKTNQGDYYTEQIFKSYPSIEKIDPEKHIKVDQHFKGYFIETEEPYFDPSCATFMDFRIDQKGETRFLYVLPESETKALVEVALFSNSLLQTEEYNAILNEYIDDFLHLTNFRILEEEFGVIPMTTYPFSDHNTERIFHIGTGGGIVKASSGFAFSRIQKHSDQLIKAIVEGNPLKSSYKGLHGRHLFYDKIMLHAMLHNGVSGEDIFTQLFEKKKATQIFKFLDQETSHLEDVGIFRAPPMWPFTQSFAKVLLGRQ